MNVHEKLVAEKLRFAVRLLGEAHPLSTAAVHLEPRFTAELEALGRELQELTGEAANAAGPDYVKQLESFGHRRGALPMGDIIARSLQMDVASLEALAVDPTFLFREAAQKLIELRGVLDGKVPVRSSIARQPGLRMARGGA